MANKIITDQTLPDQFKQDGDILYGQDINQIVSVLKAAANALKKDMDTVISGNSDVIVKYTLEELNNEVAVNGTYGFLYEDDGLKLYQKQESGWVQVQEISLLQTLTNRDPDFDTVTIGGKTLSWDPEHGTIELDLENDVHLHLGQEQYFYAKAQQDNITIGDPVMFAGVDPTQGNHFIVKIATPAALNANPEYFIGVAAQNIPAGEFGYIIEFGHIENVNLPIETYAIGDILWFDSTNGGWTKTKPTRGKAQIRVAAVLKPNQNQNQTFTGQLFVRPSILEASNGVQSFLQDTQPEVFLDGDIWFDTSNTF
jgi:hypothetical protein